jgi:hypothetical protein
MFFLLQMRWPQKGTKDAKNENKESTTGGNREEDTAIAFSVSSVLSC